MTRLVAVLGFSDRQTSGLHPVCDARLARAAEEAREDDIVLFSGWARGAHATPEADLMAASWAGPHARLVDRDARTTLGNAIAVARAARAARAEEVVVVTSRWHARRAGALTRAALLGTGATLRIAAADGTAPPSRRLREAASWLVVPFLAMVAARTR